MVSVAFEEVSGGARWHPTFKVTLPSAHDLQSRRHMKCADGFVQTNSPKYPLGVKECRKGRFASAKIKRRTFPSRRLETRRRDAAAELERRSQSGGWYGQFRYLSRRSQQDGQLHRLYAYARADRGRRPRYQLCTAHHLLRAHRWKNNREYHRGSGRSGARHCAAGAGVAARLLPLYGTGRFESGRGWHHDAAHPGGRSDAGRSATAGAGGGSAAGLRAASDAAQAGPQLRTAGLGLLIDK